MSKQNQRLSKATRAIAELTPREITKIRELISHIQSLQLKKTYKKYLGEL